MRIQTSLFDRPMTVQETSLEVYRRKVQPVLGAMQYQVLQEFTHAPRSNFTNLELAQRLGWRINRVTPRTNELRKKGLLEEACTRRCAITGNRAKAWQLVHHQEVSLVKLMGLDQYLMQLEITDTWAQLNRRLPYPDWQFITQRLERYGYIDQGNGRWRREVPSI
jgi:hypothetical protein